mmetsp:Transcript_37002/g.56716  ORF Transcript_37002/g.56716 Transcript_37002/m.56716 type:complete len:178 (-) Transcript_37002:1426-1959(-)
MRAANKQSKKRAKRRRFRQEVDTNIFKIGFSTLNDKAVIATGDPEFCKNCKAVLNQFSELKEVDNEDKQTWKCEFCLVENEVCLEEEERPQAKAINYILEAAAQVQDKKVEGNKDVSIVFCVDQSGSMCCSSPIKGKFKLKGDRTKEMQELMKFSDGSDQFMQNERNFTYVSRMQCL